jgi:hypothetical protein
VDAPINLLLIDVAECEACDNFVRRTHAHR